MASTRKTPNYNLSQFDSTDKPTWLTDYNGDMGKIDAQMKKNADAIAENTEAIEQITDTVLPAGLVAPFAGSSAPDGWLVCDGRAVSRSAYPKLFAAIGTTYGPGDGRTTFGIPDMRARVAAGSDNSHALADTAGSDTVTLTSAQLPTDGDYRMSNNGAYIVDSVKTGGASGNTLDIGNSRSGAAYAEIRNWAAKGEPVDVRQKTLYLNYIIKT